MNTILEKVKLALRITTDDFDTELTDMINACLLIWALPELPKRTQQTPY